MIINGAILRFCKRFSTEMTSKVYLIRKTFASLVLLVSNPSKNAINGAILRFSKRFPTEKTSKVYLVRKIKKALTK